jgi:fermentation-respiration switch protein FrsA (DUF1100 family)
MPTLPIRSGHLLLEGHLVLPANARALVVLLHGIPGGGPPDPPELGYPGFAESFRERGYAVLYFNFRGVRGSPGDFSLGGWAADLEAALDAAGAHDVASDLARVVVGSSAGGSVAIRVAARRPDVSAVATLAAPAGYEALGSDPGPVLARFRNLGIIHDPAFPSDPRAWWQEFTETSPEEHAARISPRPLLVVHGEEDEVVPYPHAERIYAAAREPKELVRIPGGAHQLRRDPRAVDAVLDWLDHLPIDAPAR